jgi:hypothetical protein
MYLTRILTHRFYTKVLSIISDTGREDIMKRVKNILMVLVGISFMMAGLSCDRSNVPDENAGKQIERPQVSDLITVEALITDISDENPDIRWEAVVALGEMADSRTVEPLIAALKDEDSDIREEAAEALGDISDARAVEPLIEVLREDEDSDVREVAAEALVGIGVPAVDPLIAALKVEDSDIRREAAWALMDITDQDFGEDPAKWQEWREKNK